ncbi:MAG: hypothetical protein Q4D79_04480 [Propionibacteriaceae bacterium]|nr:hypothetical protein [Propionibacteriaceae bacterium]
MSPNPLVAEREDTTTPLAGTLILEDGEALKEALDSKSWVAGGLAAVSTVADSVAAASDPLGTLFAMGVGWLLDHVQPFTGWLEELTGDADQVRAHAGTWKNIQGQMEAAAELMNGYVAADLADMSGQMIDQYRGAAGDVAKAIQGAGGWAGAMGTALEVTSFIVQVVHDIVRDAISEVIGSVMSYIVELVCTAGLALPVVLEQISTRVASLMGSVGRNVDNLVKSARNLVSKLGELRTLFQKLGNKLDEFFTGSRADLPRTDTPKGDTPPTKSDEATADGTVEGTTQPKGHEPDPNNPGYDNDGKPLRQDRGDGKPHYANDPPGTYRDKNGKLHDSKGAALPQIPTRTENLLRQAKLTLVATMTRGTASGMPTSVRLMQRSRWRKSGPTQETISLTKSGMENSICLSRDQTRCGSARKTTPPVLTYTT